MDSRVGHDEAPKATLPGCLPAVYDQTNFCQFKKWLSALKKRRADVSGSGGDEVNLRRFIR